VFAKNLQMIRLRDNSVLLKRGIHELLLEGEDALPLVEQLLLVLDDAHTREEIANSFPAPRRADIHNLLNMLVQRRLITEEREEPDDAQGADPLQTSFYWNFGQSVTDVPERLRTQKVLVVGSNLISRSIIRSLLEIGIGEVLLLEHPILSNHLTPLNPDNAYDEMQSNSRPPNNRFSVLSNLPADLNWDEISLVCATSDLGEADALLDMNRLALNAKKPFLPVWLNDLIGYVGPLNFPFETACFKCYRLRVDSQQEKRELSSARRKYIAVEPAMRAGAGFLPPMAGILGEIAAMETLKCLGQFIPIDVAASIIEVNLISFSSTVRRVLKIPRCPECSDVMRHSQKALTRGPQIPFRE
jgi:bacteriocin biosynthesis cyclodehydratase domain-containing protein